MGVLPVVLLLTTANLVQPQQYCDQKLLNNAVDFVLEQIVMSLHGSISLDNVYFSYPMGKIELVNSTLYGLKSTKRVGDVGLSVDDKLSLFLEISMSDIMLRYQKYQLTAIGIGVSGALSAKLKQINIFIEANMGSSLCFTYVTNVKASKVHDIEIDVGEKVPIKKFAWDPTLKDL
ncbi:hypothetical protein J6590_034153 [Homalodisca vitripennis]|nr:hypothetical protein J6590_034153 [Homalodisca vitripennis]